MPNLFKENLYPSPSKLHWKVSPHPIPYEEVIHFMEKRVEEIRNGQKSSCIWLLEHPPLYTSGTNSNLKEDLRVPRDSLPFSLHETGRGGRITYHGPGQRIIYCMIDLKTLSPLPDLKEFVKTLETWIIDVLKEINIEAFRQEGLIGVWTKGPSQKVSKIAALGVRIRHWISFHGISLNIDPDLSHYGPIIPCGIESFPITSLKELGFQGDIQDIDLLLRKKCPF